MYLGTDEGPGLSSDSVDNVVQRDKDKDKHDGDGDDDGGELDGPTVEAYVDLAKTACKHSITQYCHIYSSTLAVRKVYPEVIAAEIGQPDFPHLIKQFIYDQQHPGYDSDTSTVLDLPAFYEKITIYPSAVATFHAPSDISGIGGMRRERIRAVKSWRKGPGRYDTIFVNTNPSMEGMRGLDVARVRLFFSFSYDSIAYPCALVSWFRRVGDLPDDHTGMWVVEPGHDASIIHLDTVVRAAHLLPIFGPERVSKTLSFTDTLDTFLRFFVNKFADHHTFEIAC
jgi:hypothetical protein